MAPSRGIAVDPHVERRRLRAGVPERDGDAGGPAVQLRENACFRDPKADVVQEPTVEEVLPARDPQALEPLHDRAPCGVLRVAGYRPLEAPLGAAAEAPDPEDEGVLQAVHRVV
jgi:hypothetical protein